MFRDLYQGHPSFLSRYQQLEFPSHEGEQLESIYQLVYGSHSSFSWRDLDDLEGYSATLLATIFEKLNSQARDVLQQEFLADLHRESEALLRGDFVVASNRSKRCVKSTVNHARLHDHRNLQDNGFLFGNLNELDCLSLQSIAEQIVPSFRLSEEMELVKRENLSRNSGPEIKLLTKCLNEIFENNGLNRLMSIYLGYDVHISCLALEMGSSKSTWWKCIYPDVDPPQTVYMHRDEAFHAPKAFIYLNPITRQEGAFSVVPNADHIHGSPTWIQNMIGRRIGMIGRSPSHLTYEKFEHTYHQAFGDPTFRSLFISLPPECRYSSHYGWDILSSDPIHDQLLDDEVVLEGGIGSYLIFDGARITHRALAPSTNQHLSIQAIFTAKRGFVSKVISKLQKISSVHT